jgi:enolase
MSSIIEDVMVRKLFNSRGQETIEVDIITTDGLGRAAAPTGASTGKAEVVSYPKGGVDAAIKKLEELIVPELIGMDAEEQKEIDTLLHEIDATENFANVGGNTAFAISVANAEAAATSYDLPLFQYLSGYLGNELPHPLGNVLGGGKHSLGKTTDIQEYLVIPLEARSFMEASTANIRVHQKVGAFLKKTNPNFTGGRGDEGAWAPNIGNEEALRIVYKACEEVSEEMSIQCKPCLDVAASSFWDSKKQVYIYSKEGKERDSSEQFEYIEHLIEEYNLACVEDPFHEDDFESFAELTKKVKNCFICGDDLFVTNPERLTQGIKMGAGDSIIVKINQVGTLTDAWETTRLAKGAGYVPIISHRSGETTDTHIAHVSVGFSCPVIKTGVVHGERVAKINELIRIEFNLGNRSQMSIL